MIPFYLKDITILYVEDDKGFREVFSKLLKEEVKDVYSAKDGLEGYHLFKEHRPDIIITDIMMPSTNGIDMARKIREEDEFIPIVITSASSDKSYLESTLDIGVSGYMNKPINFKKLLELLSAITKILQLEDEKEAHKKILEERFNMKRLLV